MAVFVDRTRDHPEVSMQAVEHRTPDCPSIWVTAEFRITMREREREGERGREREGERERDHFFKTLSSFQVTIIHAILECI